MPVRHHLLADRALRRPEAIERVYSHPQHWGSVAALRKLVPQAELLAESSTAAAARRVATESGSAAVATLAPRVYRLACDCPRSTG